MAGRDSTALARPGQNGIAPRAQSGIAAVTADWSTALMQPDTIEKALSGDLSPLTPAQKSQYYLAKCAAMGLDPSTKPLDWITFQGKLACYPNATAAQQIADQRGIDVETSDPEIVQLGGADMVKCVGRGRTQDGRVAERTAYLAVNGAKGQDLGNLLMKAETKAFRRVVAALTGWAAKDADEILEQGGRRATITEEPLPGQNQGPVFPALAAPVDHKARAEQIARAFMDEWIRQGFSATDRTLINDYTTRALGRALTPSKDWQGRADDLAVVLSDLQDRPQALDAACAAYQEAGGDPEHYGGQTMRQEMARVFGYEFSSRRTLSSRELRMFADKCRGKEAPAADPDEADGDEALRKFDGDGEAEGEPQGVSQAALLDLEG